MADERTEPESTQGMPRWVKVLGLVVLALLLLLVIAQLTGVAGDHGPSRHSPNMDSEAPAGIGQMSGRP
jgi:hypothetical protein